ncbi:MAG: hypothetical protein WD069_21455 [Planctomycetales bacterium]
MRRFYLAINYAALVGAIAAWFHAAVLASMGGPSRVTELDRNGVFDEANLRAYSPQLAENLRYNVGHWIQEPTRSTAILYSYCLGGLAALNIIGFHLLNIRRSVGRSRTSARVDS